MEKFSFKGGGVTSVHTDASSIDCLPFEGQPECGLSSTVEIPASKIDR